MDKGERTCENNFLGDLGKHTLAYAKMVGKEIMKYNVDDYEGIFILGGALCTYLETTVPIVYYTDAVFSRIVNYYWLHVNKKRAKEGNILQRLALQRATVAVFASKSKIL